MHFVRASRADNSNAWFERLYKILFARVLRALPSADSADGKTRSLTKERIRDKISERFVEMLAGDRNIYDDRLDFFEIRFDMAIKRLRLDAQKQAWRDENRSQPISYDDDNGELSQEIEQAAGSVNPFEGPEFYDEGVPVAVGCRDRGPATGTKQDHSDAYARISNRLRGSDRHNDL